MPYIAELDLTRAWLTDVLTPDVSPIVSGTVRPSDWTDARDGEVRQYAGGRRQGVGFTSTMRTEAVTFIGLSASQLALMRKRKGYPQLFRSALGERFYCEFFELSVHNHPLATSLNGGRGGFDVTVTLYEIDYDESV